MCIFSEITLDNNDFKHTFFLASACENSRRNFVKYCNISMVWGWKPTGFYSKLSIKLLYWAPQARVLKQSIKSQYECNRISYERFLIRLHRIQHHCVVSFGGCISCCFKQTSLHLIRRPGTASVIAWLKQFSSCRKVLITQFLTQCTHKRYFHRPC